MRKTLTWPVVFTLAIGMGCTGNTTGDDATSSSSSSGGGSSRAGSSGGGGSSNGGLSSSAAGSNGGSSGATSAPASSVMGTSSSNPASSQGGGSSGVSAGSSVGGSSGVVGSSSGVVGSSSGVVGSSSGVVGSSSGAVGSSSGVVGSSSGAVGSSSGGGAENCAQAGDEDGDLLPNCVDPDCQGNAACVPGNTALGGACTAATDCQATGGDPVCFNDVRRPGGYCTHGCTTNPECGPNAECLVAFGAGAPVGACSALCTPGPNSGCRLGYECNTFGARSFCMGAEIDAECSNLLDDDGDGRADCADPSCRVGTACMVGLGAVGTTCTAANQCSATDNDPACLSEAGAGYPAGYCSEFCDPTLNGTGGTNAGCSAAGVCVTFTDAGLCLDACQAPADCRQGYTCRDFNGVRGCFPACTGNADCAGTGYCELNTNSTNLGFCTPAPVCGNGIVQGQEQCDPPDGLGCTTGCLTQELNCTNLTDDDADQLYDCQDPDCAASCAPGNTPTGGPCTANTDCQATGNDPLCFTSEGFPQGYCAEYCVPGATPGTGTGCTGDAVCRDLGDGFGICYDRCAVQADCRQGYACGTEARGTPNAYSVCFPAEDDAEACSDGGDNDGNGTPDCMDPNCKPLAVCTPGQIAAGGPCAANNNCAATTGADPICLNEDQYGYPNGLCSEWCNPQDANPGCPVGATCVAGAANPAVGICQVTCVVGQTTCRDGYACEALPQPATVSACAPNCTANTQCASNKCYTAGGFCLTVPAAWTCDATWYGGGPNDGCDCGCGAVDFDCGANPTITTCQFCHCSGTGGQDCPEQVNPESIAQCL